MNAPTLTCSCGVTFTASSWTALPFVGHQADGAGGVIELRNCTACGSTRSIEVPGRSDDDGRIIDACRKCAAVDAIATNDGLCAACLALFASCAQPGCYGCLGAGFIDGFGCTGMLCPCVAVCDDCGKPFQWEGDGESPPESCPKCDARTPVARPEHVQSARRCA